MVRCHAAPDELDILKDISAKVDVLFDQSPLGRSEDEETVAVIDVEAVEGAEAVDSASRHRQGAPAVPLRKRSRGGRRRRPDSNHAVEADSETATEVPAPAPPPATTTVQPWTTLPAEAESSSVTSPDTVPPTTASTSTSVARPPDAAATLAPGHSLDLACGVGVAEALSALTRAIHAVAAVATLPHASNASTTHLGNATASAHPSALEDCANVNGGSGEYDLGGRRVYCDMDTDGGGWTVVQRRGDWGEPRLNFSRSWDDYREGFGNPSREYWIGNKWLHRMTAARPLALRVDLWDWDGEHAVAEYASFRVADESDQFRLSVAEYSGNATDALAAHSDKPFSTWDANHDTAPACCPCAPAYSAGWWFYSCFEANLNGEFHTHPEENEYYRGIIWEGWRGDYSLRAASMMVRTAASAASAASAATSTAL